MQKVVKVWIHLSDLSFFQDCLCPLHQIGFSGSNLLGPMQVPLHFLSIMFYQTGFRSGLRQLLRHLLLCHAWLQSLLVIKYTTKANAQAMFNDLAP